VAHGTVVVLGSEAPALALAATLSRDGHEVILWEAAGTVEACEGTVKLSETEGESVVKLAAVTTDIFAALSVADMLIACPPAHAQSGFADFVLPLVEPRHTLVLPAGGLAGLGYAKWLRDRGRYALPTFVETDVAPFLTRRTGPGHVRIAASIGNLSIGVFPAERSAVAVPGVRRLLPGARAVPHLVAAALAGIVPFLRAPALLLNAGRIERGRGPFALLEEGFSPGVACLAEALDAERLAIGAALGQDLPEAAAALHELGLSPLGGLWAAVNGSRVLTREADLGDALAPSPTAGPSAEVVWILRPWAELADQIGVSAPVIKALHLCAATAAGGRGLAAGRSLKDLGIAGMSPAALVRYLETGSDEPRS
jgi:opine dehydrogenase